MYLVFYYSTCMYVEEERDIGIIQVNVWRSIKESYSWYAKCIANAIVSKIKK